MQKKLSLIVLILSVLALNVSAQKKLGFSGRPTTAHERNLADYVDYSEIHNDLGERQVIISIGHYSFVGRLHDDGMKVSDEKVDEIVRRTFNEMKLSGGKLQRIEEDLANAEMGQLDWNGMLADLVSALGTQLPFISMGNDLYKLTNGDQDCLLTIFNIGSTAALAAAATAASPYIALVAGIGGGAMTLISLAELAVKNSGNMSAAIDFFTKLLDGDPVGKRTLEGAAERYDFYRRINARIAVEAMKNATGWVFDVDSSDDSPKSLFGASVKQMAHLTAHMTLTSHSGTNSAVNWQGSYSGAIKLTLTHNLTAFDSGFKDDVLMKSYLPFFKSQALEFPGEAEGPQSELFKQLYLDDYTIDLRSSDGTIIGGMTQRFTFKNFHDKSFFHCRKDLLGRLNYVIWQHGELQAEGLSGNSEINLGFLGSLVDNRCSAALKVATQEDFVQTEAARYTYNENLAAINVNGQPLFIDRKIFSDLRNGMFITIAPRKVTWL